MKCYDIYTTCEGYWCSINYERASQCRDTKAYWYSYLSSWNFWNLLDQYFNGKLQCWVCFYQMRNWINSNIQDKKIFHIIESTAHQKPGAGRPRIFCSAAGRVAEAWLLFFCRFVGLNWKSHVCYPGSWLFSLRWWVSLMLSLIWVRLPLEILLFILSFDNPLPVKWGNGHKAG